MTEPISVEQAQDVVTVHAHNPHVCLGGLTFHGQRSCFAHRLASAYLAEHAARLEALNLGAEEWGVVVDALIQHRGHADQRKTANSESTSDMRADICADLIKRINAHCLSTHRAALGGDHEQPKPCTHGDGCTKHTGAAVMSPEMAAFAASSEADDEPYGRVR